MKKQFWGDAMGLKKLNRQDFSFVFVYIFSFSDLNENVAPLAPIYFPKVDKAEKDKQYAAAINAEYRSGQLAGAYVDRKEVTVSGVEGMSREQLEKKLEELSNKIDGYNAKTIEIESEDVTAIEEG